MQLGIDNFLTGKYEQFKGKRIGLVTNMTGVNQQLKTTIDLFHQHPDIQLVALYSPEHGIRGDAKEGEEVGSSVDKETNLPVYSLYGDMRKPTKEMLLNVDVMVFDLQDIGSRYYTYIYTMAYVMEACAELDKQFVVLDRPNPISGLNLEGNLVEEAVRSFVGLLPIPNRHGMTVGELAQLFKHEFGYHCDLTVVPMTNWTRDMYYEDTDLFWIPPSPNTTDTDMMILYTGTCLFEGTNVSEGRGTTKPFEWIGAPFINGKKLADQFNKQQLAGVLARPVSFVPTYQKHTGETCEGVQLHISDRNKLHALKTGITLLEVIMAMYPKEFTFIENENGKFFFDLLAGTKKLKQLIKEHHTAQFFEQCQSELQTFKKQRKQYLIYN